MMRKVTPKKHSHHISEALLRKFERSKGLQPRNPLSLFRSKRLVKKNITTGWWKSYITIKSKNSISNAPNRLLNILHWLLTMVTLTCFLMNETNILPLPGLSVMAVSIYRPNLLKLIIAYFFCGTLYTQ